MIEMRIYIYIKGIKLIYKMKENSEISVKKEKF